MITARNFYVGSQKFGWSYPSEDTTNSDYINTLNVNYHKYKLNLFSDSREGNNDFALLALNQNYMELLEYATALVCGTIQAMDVLVLWMTLYKNNDLVNLSQNLLKCERVLTPFSDGELSLEDLAGSIAGEQTFYSTTIFESLKLVLSEYCISEFQDDYNATKHGNRAQPGTFNLKTEDSVFQFEAAIFTTRPREIPKNRLPGLDGIKKIYAAEFHIQALNREFIIKRSRVILSLTSALIEALKRSIDQAHKSPKIEVPTLDEIKSIWSGGDGRRVVMTPSIEINGIPIQDERFKSSTEK